MPSRSLIILKDDFFNEFGTRKRGPSGAPAKNLNRTCHAEDEIIVVMLNEILSLIFFASGFITLQNTHDAP